MSKVEDVSHMTGENAYKRPPKSLIINEVSFNGKEGKFMFRDLINRKEGEKAEKKEIGDSIQVIFLKLRRRISGYNNKQEKFYTSTEHNDKKDTVYLFGVNKKGTAEELYEEFKPLLKTERVIYAYLLREGQDKELVRVIVKGSALNPNRAGKKDGVNDLFTYINDKQKDEHSYMFVTKMTAVEESGPLGKYYTIDFKRGTKLPEDKLNVVVEKIKELHQMSVEQDNYYKVEENVPEGAGLPVIEYPDDDINVDDIPF